MPIIETSDGPLSFQESGAGDPIVLLHGIQGTARTWEAVAPLLGPDHRVIRPNLRGRADSHSPSDGRSYSLHGFAHDLAAVMHLAGDAAILVAWSMGVSVTFEMLRQRHPVCIRGLVLVSGTPFAGTQARWFNSEGMSELELEARERAAKLRLPEAAHPFAVAAAWRSIQRADYREFLQSVSYPTLVIHGSDDDQCPIDHGRLMARLVPGAQLDEWRGCGHNPMVHDPGRFGDAVMRFAQTLRSSDS